MPRVKNPLLHRYWIELEREATRPPQQIWASLVCGVTAYTYEDALALIQHNV